MKNRNKLSRTREVRESLRLLTAVWRGVGHWPRRRTKALGYSVGDGVRQQFTSKERDIETNLDYFEARYYSSVQGRFTSVDPENAGSALNNPQSWNAYSYSLNNPLRFIDPDGLRWAQIDYGGGLIGYGWFDDKEKDDNGQTAYDRALANGYSAVTFDESKSYSITNGLIAPGETLTTFTLNPDGSKSVSYHTVTKREFATYAYAVYLAGGDTESVALEFVASLVGHPTDISAPYVPDVPAPFLGPWRNVTPSRSLNKMGHAQKHLGDFKKLIPV